MQAQLNPRPSIRERTIAFGASHAAINAVAIAVLVVWCAALFGYLLARYPYDGLYGQDSYAYYYQARAILHDMTGQASQPWQLFSGAQLYHWPVGYHLLIIVGQVISGSVAGGRTLTILAAVGAIVMLYLLTGELWFGATFRERVVAGLVAGGILPLVATFTRMGLSVMADVPALFLGLLGIYCCLQAWPLHDPGFRRGAYGVAWAVTGGLALGLAVLTRYGAVFFSVSIGVYYLVRRITRPDFPRNSVGAMEPGPWWALLGFAVGMLPQLIYLISYNELVPATAGVTTGDWLNSWSPANLFSTTVTGPDGTSTFGQPMIVFYLLAPFYDSDAGFLSGFYLPALLTGAFLIARVRVWPLSALLLSWWLPPVIFFAGSPYQAQRFALTYLPAFLILIAIGFTWAVESGLRAISTQPTVRHALIALIAGVVVLGLALGAIKEQGSLRGWMAIHESFKVEERDVVALARQAAGSNTGQDPPRIVAFGMTSALYHYTQWPTIELFNSDEAVLASFLGAPSIHLLVLPEADMSRQWANTTLAARWFWLQQNYAVSLQGVAGSYSVYRIGALR